MDVPFYQRTRSAYGLLGVHLAAEVEGDFVVACAWCETVYEADPVSGNTKPGLSHGLCEIRHAGYDCTNPDEVLLYHTLRVERAGGVDAR